METQNNEARNLVVQAREALRRGDKETAKNLGEQAALLDPGMEDAWLVLTAVDPNPEDALAYAQQALEINPSSIRALKAVEWAMARLKEAQTPAPAGVVAAGVPAAAAASAATAVPKQAVPQAKKSTNKNLFIFGGVFLCLLLCAFAMVAAYTVLGGTSFASMLEGVSVPTQENLWAPADIVRTSATPVESGSLEEQAADTPAAQPTREAVAATSTPMKNATSVPTETPAAPPTNVPTQAATATPQFTETPGVISMEIVEDTPTSQYTAPTSSAQLPQAATSGNGERWIDVDLTNQRVYAYEGDVIVNSFIVSTGTWLTPTVTGQYKVYVKYRSAPMSGPGYYLPNVPYIMYFYKGYGLHGTYWHNNFGTPMSHGCVNLRTEEAGWLYNWASVGTLVNVHY